jgi:hypothetical protein
MKFHQAIIWRLRGVLTEARNCALTDIVTPCDAALRFARCDALAGLFLLVGCERRPAAESDALFLGSARPRAVRSKMHRRSSFAAHAEDGKDDLGEIGRRIEERLCQ